MYSSYVSSCDGDQNSMMPADNVSLTISIYAFISRLLAAAKTSPSLPGRHSSWRRGNPGLMG